MTSSPWDEWIPGVLSKRQVGKLIEKHYIENAGAAVADHSSLDLTIAPEAFELLRGCIKPFGHGYREMLQTRDFAQALALHAHGTFLLRQRKTYVLRIVERIGALNKSKIYGTATAKSSVGRMDVLARLIVDGMDEYEGFRPDRITSGEMFLEVTPMTFNVLVKPGTSLTQLRFFNGHPNECRLDGKALLDTVLFGNPDNKDATLSVDLTPAQVSGHPVTAFRASLEPNEEVAIPLWKQDEKDKPKPWHHWKFQATDNHGRLQITKDQFYIIRSREKIWLPRGVAVYCRASDETIGEMRIHYAGFVHPFFGGERSDQTRGTPLIFEVRGHDVDVSLRDGEKMARLEFFRMAEDCKEPKGGGDNAYKDQSLKLSSFFAEWPDAADVVDGTVTPREH